MTDDFPRAADGVGDAAGHRQVVVFDQDAVIQPHPVIAPASDRHRVFFQYSQPGRGLAGVYNLPSRARDGLNVLARDGGYAGKVLKEVQRHALGREQHLGVADHAREDLARFDLLAVGHGGFDLNVFIEPAENQVGDLKPGENQILFCDEAAARVQAEAHDRTRGDVAAPDIFVKRAIDDLTSDKQIEWVKHNGCRSKVEDRRSRIEGRKSRFSTNNSRSSILDPRFSY